MTEVSRKIICTAKIIDMTNNNDKSISYRLKRQTIANSWLCSNVVLHSSP